MGFLVYLLFSKIRRVYLKHDNRQANLNKKGPDLDEKPMVVRNTNFHNQHSQEVPNLIMVCLNIVPLEVMKVPVLASMLARKSHQLPFQSNQSPSQVELTFIISIFI